MTARQAEKSFALYHSRVCPFCIFATNAMRGLNVNVSLRDVNKTPQFRSELIREGGKSQVPCLRIEHEGKVRWLYESYDIVEYLRRESQAASAPS